MSAASESVRRLFKGDVWVFWFLSSHSVGRNPHSFLQSDFGGTPLPDTEPLGWGPLCGARACGSFRGTSAAAISPGAQLPGIGAGPAHFISPPLL